jgi:hypothetical protein
VAWSDQDWPFHISASWPDGELSPTASQNVAERHFTALSWNPARPAMACGCHEVPFHTSASGTYAPELFRYLPTASQNVAPTHDTALG